MNLQNLRFRRQFLLSATICEELRGWKQEKLDSHFLYVHPECEITRIDFHDFQVILIGYLLDPHRPHFGNCHIIEEFAKVKFFDEIHELLYPLAGRFAVLIKNDKEFRIYHDACGLRSVYYTFVKKEIYAASQPNLLKLVVPLVESSRYKKYFGSVYVKSYKEHYLPAGISVYEDVDHLLPNHYLLVNNEKQMRYWPNKKPAYRSLESGVAEISELLKKIMRTAHSKYKIAVPITGGFDSRLLLSACKEIKDEIQFYSLQYRDLNETSPDLHIPKEMASDLNLNHRVVDCRNKIDQNFLRIYEGNSSTPHVDDWGIIASGMYQGLEADLLAVKGNCTEIGRCARYKDGKHPKNMGHEFLVALEPNWKTLDFISERMNVWHNEIKMEKNNMGYHELDLFYWEHRMGKWQAQSQLEWDIVQEVFTPFNNREMIDLMLSVEIKYRIRPNYILFKNLIRRMWPELLNYPINPQPFSTKMFELLKKIAMKLGVFKILKRLIKPQE